MPEIAVCVSRPEIDADLAHVLGLLDTWTLRRTPTGIVGLAPAPTWWVAVHGTDPADEVSGYLRQSPFLASFLPDADAFWKGGTGRLSSGEWLETAGGGACHHLEATALCTRAGGLLLIRLLGIDGHEAQQLLQKAREGVLHHKQESDAHESRAAQLRRRTDELEACVAEGSMELRAALAEQQALLRELHHRAGNSIQVVASLLSLQAGHVSNTTLRDELTQSGRRIQAIGLAHQIAYGAGEFSHVNVADYLSRLVDGLLAALPPGTPATARVDAAPVTIDIGAAVPLGLLVNELLAGAARCDPTGVPARMFDVQLRALDGGRLELAITDTAGRLPDTPGSFATDLIGVLAEQLGATVGSGASGSAWTLEFAS